LSHLNLEKKDEVLVNTKSSTCWELKLIDRDRESQEDPWGKYECVGVARWSRGGLYIG
jgi:hypothetical protein